MNTKHFFSIFLFITGLLSIMYALFGLVRLIENANYFITQGMSIIDIIIYNADYVFLSILSLGSGFAQIIVGWLIGKFNLLDSQPEKNDAYNNVEKQ